MKMKKILAMAASTVLCGAMCVSCGKSESSSDNGSSSDNVKTTAENNADNDSSSDSLIKVGIINNDPNESGYRTANVNDLKATFTEENGFDASFSYSLKNEEQINAAQKFIQDEVDYLLLSAADTSGWDSVLNDAKDAGVRVRTDDTDKSPGFKFAEQEMRVYANVVFSVTLAPSLPNREVIYVR